MHLILRNTITLGILFFLIIGHVPVVLSQETASKANAPSSLTPQVSLLTPSPDVSTFRVVGYLPDYRIAEFDMRQMESLTDLILFSAEINPDLSLNVERLSRLSYPELLRNKTLHRTRVILCIGGWERSQHFGAASASTDACDRFAENALNYCLQHRLDGIDLDWEHPKDATEQAGYVRLASALRKRFEPVGLTLSVTMAAWQETAPELFPHVDWVQIMAYDHPGEHSTLTNSMADVDKLLKRGAKKSQLVLGMPFYGRNIEHPDQTIVYRDIQSKASKKELTNDRWNGYYFNGPSTIEAKTKYALREKLAGIMFWELGQDAPGAASLLSVARRTIRSAER